MIMKKFAITSIFFAMLAMACNNAAESTADNNGDTSAATEPTPVATSSLAGCYRMVLNERDTVSLQLSAEGDQLTGPLYYHWYEKDKNDGVFSGNAEDDRITGWYTFNSEGMTSVRQLIWKVDGDNLYPATGDIDQKADSIIFKDPATVNFDTKNFLKKVECADVAPM